MRDVIENRLRSAASCSSGNPDVYDEILRYRELCAAAQDAYLVLAELGKEPDRMTERQVALRLELVLALNREDGA